MTRRGGRFQRVMHHGRTLLAMLGAATLIVAATPVTSWVAHRMAGHFDTPQGDVLVVLTAAAPTDGVLSGSDHVRCIYAVRAWRAGRFQKLLISGEAAVPMRDFLATQGVPAWAIQVEERSRSTHESALNVAPLVQGANALVLLTSDYHMYRAGRAFRRAGMRVLPYPVPDAYKRSTFWYLRETVFAEEMREVAKIAWYGLKGWI